MEQRRAEVNKEQDSGTLNQDAGANGMGVAGPAGQGPNRGASSTGGLGETQGGAATRDISTSPTSGGNNDGTNFGGSTASDDTGSGGLGGDGLNLRNSSLHGTAGLADTDTDGMAGMSPTAGGNAQGMAGPGLAGTGAGSDSPDFSDHKRDSGDQPTSHT